MLVYDVKKRIIKLVSFNVTFSNYQNIPHFGILICFLLCLKTDNNNTGIYPHHFVYWWNCIVT